MRTRRSARQQRQRRSRQFETGLETSAGTIACQRSAGVCRRRPGRSQPRGGPTMKMGHERCEQHRAPSVPAGLPRSLPAAEPDRRAPGRRAWRPLPQLPDALGGDPFALPHSEALRRSRLRAAGTEPTGRTRREAEPGRQSTFGPPRRAVDGADLGTDWLRALMMATGWPALLAQLEIRSSPRSATRHGSAPSWRCSAIRPGRRSPPAATWMKRGLY